MSTILTTSGKAAMLNALKSQPLFVAFGSGDPSWGSTVQNKAVTFVAGNAAIGVNYPGAVVVSNGSGVTYTLNSDYILNNVTGALTTISGGRIAPNATVYVTYTILPPPPAPNATSLIAEIGWKRILNYQFVVPDDFGPIQVTAGSFSAANVPTNYLYLQLILLQGELPTATIREYAIYANTQVAPGLPGGQALFSPAQIVDRGGLVTVTNTEPIVRNPMIREQFSFVLGL
jgi:hypothetical protein